MAKHSTHSELERLIEVARLDVPSVEEQKQLHASVLSALHSGAVPLHVLAAPPLYHPSRIMGPALKLIVSVGTAGLLAVGLVQLQGHWRQTSQPDKSSLALLPSARADAGELAPDKSPVIVPSQTAPVYQDEPEPPSPSLQASASSGSALAPTLHRTTTAKPQSSEAEIIEQARRQLQNNPAQALAFTKTHGRLYPKGILAQEREVIAIEALARLGKSKAAEKRADAFRAAQPNSIHDLHLRSTLGDAGVRPSL